MGINNFCNRAIQSHLLLVKYLKLKSKQHMIDYGSGLDVGLFGPGGFSSGDSLTKCLGC